MTVVMLGALSSVTLHQNALAACNVINGKAFGECGNVTIRNGPKPHLNVRGSKTESAIVSGATVYAGGYLHLSGVSGSDITVHKGGRLLVSGVVNATIHNLGGQVEVEGIVDSLVTVGGKVIIGGSVGAVSGSGAIMFRRGSVLGGVPFEQQTHRSGG